MKNAWPVLVAAVIGLSMLPALGQEASPKPVKPYVAWWGAHSRVEQAAYLRVTSAEDWQSLWARHAGEVLETPYRIPKFPEVDFDQCMVVAVFGGKTVNTRGLAVASVTEEKDLLRFRFDRTSRSYQTGPEGDRVTPYAIAVLPRSPKPVVFEEDVHSLKNEESQWKERARVE